MKRVFVLLTAAFLSGSFAADKKVEELLLRMRTAYQITRTASLSTRVMVSDSPARTAVVNLQMDYERPNKVRATIDVGAAKGEVYSDGNRILAIDLKGNRKVGNYSSAVLAGTLAGNLETISFFDWKRQLSTAPSANMRDSQLKLLPKESWNGRMWTVLQENAPKQKVLVKYYIDPATNFIWRTIVKKTDTKLIVQDAQLTKLSLGVPMDPNRFKLPK